MTTTCRCDNCNWTGDYADVKITLEEVPDLAQRLNPGGEVPAGECPKCGALCYIMPLNLVTGGERSLFRWQYRMLGGFERTLWIAISTADSHSLNALAKGFPEHVAAYHRYTTENGYLADLCQRIGAV